MTEERQNAGVKARRIVEQLERIAAEHGAETLAAVVDNKLSGPEVRAGLLYMALFDAKRQAGQPIRFEVDHPAVDCLRMAEPEASAVRKLIDRLEDQEQREALVELVLLHTELTAVEQAAATGAALN